MKKHNVANIFDLHKDSQGVTRMPFNPHDYGEDSHVLRRCYKCHQEFEQGQMKELSVRDTGNEFVYHDGKSIHARAIFYCRTCWFADDISDASKWIG